MLILPLSSLVQELVEKKNTKTEKNTGILSSFIHAFRKFISAKELLSHTLSILNNYSN